MIFDAAAASVVSVATVYADAKNQRLAAMLAAMTPEQRLEASEEVRLARERIQSEGLVSERADLLLAFARDLAERRMN